MSADRRLGAIVCTLAACTGGGAFAAEEEVPETDFLEYLGIWEESDEVWLIFEDSMAAENEEQGDQAPEGDASPENEDEV